jgi:hypothetical protein
MHYESAESTPQGGGETGWILETNEAMNRGMEGMGGTVTRRYRFYERLLVEGAEPSLPDAEAFPWRTDTSHSGANEATLAADDA